MKQIISDFVALLIPYKEREKVHSWVLIIAVLVFYAAIGYIVTIAA